MELHHDSRDVFHLDHPCVSVLPSNAPALPTTPLPGPSIRSRVLQERSGNRRHTFDEGLNVWKRSASPIEKVYAQPLGGTYFTTDIAQPVVEKSEEQVDYEFSRLWPALHQSDDYRKYRERQPVNNEGKEQKWPDQLEYAFFKGVRDIIPACHVDHVLTAPALVRWPPMGRKKLMVNGRLQGRNELVTAYIDKMTGSRRDRKKVSSHLQVLKKKLSDSPLVMLYLGPKEEEEDKKPRRGSRISHSRLQSRHRLKSSRYEFAPGRNTAVWQDYSALPSPRMLVGANASTYSLTDFAMYVEDATKTPVHYYTRLFDNARLEDLNVTDISAWNKQYPELAFHGSELWKDRQVLVCDASINIMLEKPPQDADLSIQFNVTSSDDLSAYEPLESRARFYDSGVLADQADQDSIKKETRCDCEYDAGSGRVSMKFGSRFWVGRMSKFSQKCRETRALDEKNARIRVDVNVRRPLQAMTAVQDLYGMDRRSGVERCLLTILWRFHQTRTQQEPGRTNWRVVRFPGAAPTANGHEDAWVKMDTDELHVGGTAKDIRDLIHSTTAAPSNAIYHTMPLEYHTQHPLSQDHQFQPQPHHHQHQQHLPHPLDLSNLSAIPLDSIPEYPHSATAPSMATDYSQTHSLASLTHSQDTAVSQSQDFHDTNTNASDIDFAGGHINVCLEPDRTISDSLAAYERYVSHPSNAGMPNMSMNMNMNMNMSMLNPTPIPMPGFEHQHPHAHAHQLPCATTQRDYADMEMSLGACLDDVNVNVLQDQTQNQCYPHPTKPWPEYPDLIERLEGVAEQGHVQHHQQSHDQHQHQHQGGLDMDIAGHGVLHGHNHGNAQHQHQPPIWKLQSPFQTQANLQLQSQTYAHDSDTASGANALAPVIPDIQHQHRKESRADLWS
ncbi:TEA/ATTS domain family-domain-containing protein [Clohesyomyces aquaticus]|uniref:TEA/ATTS domain family-domain-containing protein n=1 Tax=Clohesyomyces aquaticus TaxID=1231657 RepID=A0A1Y2A123_9PLEO|nr:TEA/ATTS domain family-domain-containing protein [Clohesyomyces aquaticus]